MEASATQQREDWIRSNERALHYYGGGVQVIIPDNLRSAVSRSDPYEQGINSQFDAFAQHYGVVIMPARVRHARDKALVESAVRLTYQRIYPPLRDRTFHSLEELNAAIRPLLEQHNARRFSAAALLTARAVRTDRAAHPGAVAGAPLPAAADPGSDAPHHAACAKVLRGLRNHWEGLTLFVEHADLPMDNYLSSRARAARPGGGERFDAAAECSSPAREQSAAPPAGPLPVDTNAMM